MKPAKPAPVPVVAAPTAALDPATLDKMRSELSQGLQARGRRVHVFDVAGVFGLAGRPVNQIAMQILPNGEERESILAAHATVAIVAKRAGAGIEAAKADTDLFTNEKNIEALFRICRRVDAKGNATLTAAFPGPAWMSAELSTDEIAVLLNLYDEHKRKHGPAPVEVDDETIEAVATMLGEHMGDDIPEAFLAKYARWFLTHFAVMVSYKLAEARKSVEILLLEREAWQLERIALEAELVAARAQLERLAGPPSSPASIPAPGE